MERQRASQFPHPADVEGGFPEFPREGSAGSRHMAPRMPASKPRGPSKLRAVEHFPTYIPPKRKRRDQCHCEPRRSNRIRKHAENGQRLFPEAVSNSTRQTRPLLRREEGGSQSSARGEWDWSGAMMSGESEIRGQAQRREAPGQNSTCGMENRRNKVEDQSGLGRGQADR
jgi:hypothetical protein